MMLSNEKIEQIVAETKEREGFDGTPYDDHLGNPTIGYGTLLPITEKEADLLLRHRIMPLISNIPFLDVITDMPPEPVIEVLIDMSYQMGLDGMLRFKLMLQAIRDKDYNKAADELLDSRYANQTPGRANKNADILRNVRTPNTS